MTPEVVLWPLQAQAHMNTGTCTCIHPSHTIPQEDFSIFSPHKNKVVKVRVKEENTKRKHLAFHSVKCKGKETSYEKQTISRWIPGPPLSLHCCRVRTVHTAFLRHSPTQTFSAAPSHLRRI